MCTRAYLQLYGSTPCVTLINARTSNKLIALDADATSIHIIIDISKFYVRIVDNGKGLSETELKQVAVRHGYVSWCARLEIAFASDASRKI